MEELLRILSDHFVPALIAFCFLVTVALKTLTVAVASVSRERTRREIAAYIAEGSLTPEQGERLLKADTNRRA